MIKVPEESIKQQVVESLVWFGGLKYVGQVITWAITIIIIRLLTPSDYGLMAMASACTGFITLISEVGLGSAIVQKKNIDRHQLSQVQGFGILSGNFLFLILYFSAPLIAKYFSEPRLVQIIRILSLSILLYVLYMIPQAILYKNMDFRSKSIVDFIAAIVSCICSLIFALCGYGVWALVWGVISIHFVKLLGYYIFSQCLVWPSFLFGGIKELITFGSLLTGARILWYLYTRADIFIGGRFLGRETIGIYSVALELSAIPLEKFLPIINRIAFPAYSIIQSDTELVRSYFLKSVRMVSLILIPVFWGMLIIAPQAINLLLGSKWGGTILLLQILCVVMPFKALGTLFAPILNGIGRPEINFSNVAIATVIMPTAFFIGVRWGTIGLSLSWLFGYPIYFLILCKRSLHVIGPSLVDFYAAIKAPIIASAFMALGISYLHYQIGNSLSLLPLIFISISSGIIIYVGLIYFANRKVFYELLGLFAQIRKKTESI